MSPTNFCTVLAFLKEECMMYAIRIEGQTLWSKLAVGDDGLMWAEKSYQNVAQQC